MTTMPRPAPIAFALAIALGLAAPIAFATQTVTTCADSGAGSLRAAIAAASAADTVEFDTASMNCSTITLTTGAITINANDITLAGPGADALTIDANQASRVIDHLGSGTLNVNNLTIANGNVVATYSFGGCINSNGTIALLGSAVHGCTAQAQTMGVALGGGIYANGDLHLTRSTIANCQARRYLNDPAGSQGGASGGGAHAHGNAVVQFSTVSGNYASTYGGGLTVAGANVTVGSSTFSNNQGGIGAGLAMTAYAGQASIINTTVSGNSGALCAGVYSSGIFGAATTLSVSLSNSTIAFNTTSQSNYNGHNYAAGLCSAGSLNAQSSIIANNNIHVGMMDTAADFSAHTGTSIAGANNLIMVTLSGTTPPAGTLTADPMLAALANNGGPTMTHSLPIGSPAIGTGNNTSRLPSDQRGPGFARMTGEKTDIGAFQTGDGIFAGGFE
jgi:hypothetical protein